MINSTQGIATMATEEQAGHPEEPTDNSGAQTGQDTKLVALVGYRRGKTPDHVRLYESRDSQTYVEIKLRDVVDPPSRSPRPEPGQTVIWVRPKTKVRLSYEYEVHNLAHRKWPR